MRVFRYIILFSLQCVGIAASAVSVPATVQSGTQVVDSKGNPVTQLFGFVKDQAVRTASGFKELWANHGRCNEIRAKQKDYREKLKLQWELKEKDLSRKEMKARLAAINGGVTYDEFIFLAKGKEDRTKVMNMVFIMWGAPKIFPYALMFYPNILPSPFAPLPDASGRETKLEKLSRQRSHAVMKTLLDLEDKARTVPYLSKLNIFGKKAQATKMENIDNFGKSMSTIMTTPGAKGGRGAAMVMQELESILYKKGEPFTRGEKRLVGVPNAIIFGLMNSISGPGILNGFMPNFMQRGNVMVHAQKIAEADNFLIRENIDLDTLSTARLLEACNDRLIAACGRSNDELRNDLSDWLQAAVVEPATRIAESGEEFNENLARAALMGYYSLEAARDSRCASYLTRSLFQGPQIEDAPSKK